MKHFLSLTCLIFVCMLNAKEDTGQLEQATQDTVSSILFNALEEWHTLSAPEKTIWKKLREKPYLRAPVFYEFCDNQLASALDFILQEKKQRCEQETDVNAKRDEERDYNLYEQHFRYFKSLRTLPPETRYPFYERIRLELPRDGDNQGALVFGETHD